MPLCATATCVNEAIAGRQFCAECYVTETGRAPPPPKKSTFDGLVDAYLAGQQGAAPVFVIKKRENGEVYHCLVSRLIHIGVRFDLTAASANQSAFIQYYAPKSVIADAKSVNADSRKGATEIIVGLFARLASAQDQSVAHRGIAKLLNAVPWSTADHKVTISGVVGPCLAQHLADSKQPALLAPAAGSRVAFVWVRRQAAAADKRVMDPTNLKAVLQSLLAMNALAADAKALAAVPPGFALKGQKIGQVILFGDIGELATDPELRQHAKMLDDAKVPCACIPMPFSPAGQKSKALAQLTAETEDGLPVECKIFGIYLALQEMYGAELFAVGFRSGSLDGPAFPGIPILSFDDTTWHAGYTDGDYLFTPDAKSERMLDVAKVMSTYIRINHDPNLTGMGPDDVMRLDATALKHFKQAMLTWIMLRMDAKDSPPLWAGRIQLIKGASIAALAAFVRKAIP